MPPKRAANNALTRLFADRNIGPAAFVFAAMFCLVVASAKADSKPVAYALLIGSSKPGPGQAALRYAHRDAEHLAEVLGELSAYPKSHMTVLRDPRPAQIFAALDAIAAKLREHHARDEKTKFLFYYSGHARARAINLGADEVPITELKAKLEELPATVTLAILDACQTGAISGVKGAARAPDFSYHSVDELRTSGVVVIASSSASEFSQEAQELGASYFTHHLVVALRGAADNDRDGRVTLDEAYQYAYHRTLIDTSKTAVGKQHPTLETKLTGKGEMVLSEPRLASSSLVLAEALAGELLIFRADMPRVVAEVHKTRGSAVKLALAPGRYRVLQGGHGQPLYECRFELRNKETTTFTGSGCQRVAEPSVAAKGDQPPALHERRRWFHLALELGIGISFVENGDYVRTLKDYGYANDGKEVAGNLQLTALLHLNRYFAVGLSGMMLGGRGFEREIDLSSYLTGPDTTYTDSWYAWYTYGLAAILRASYPLQDGLVIPYIELSAGISLADREIRYYSPNDLTENSLQVGEMFASGLGVSIMPWQHLGVFGQGGYRYAAAPDNAFQERHNSGGVYLLGGIRGAL